jgi:hypothetical protein
MVVPVILLAVLAFIAAKPSKRVLLQSYCSVSQTRSIKGVFVITVFFYHFFSYVHLESWYDLPLRYYCSCFGQLMVAPFFFYSGYGIFESIKTKGRGYIQSFPKQRILKTLLHFDFAVCLFLLLDLLIEERVSVSRFMLSLVGWESIGNSNWFIFAILCAYVSVFSAMVLFGENLSLSLLLVTALLLVYAVVISQFKGLTWYDTIFAFPLGCLLSLHKTKFESIILQRKLIAPIGALIGILILSVTQSGIIPPRFNIIKSQIALLAFLSVIVFLSLHIHFENRILNWFGTHVFGVYIMQRIPMNLFSFLHLNEYNIYLFFVLSFASTLVLSSLFSKWNTFFDSVVLKSSH